jgi:hypothetical protein
LIIDHLTWHGVCYIWLGKERMNTMTVSTINAIQHTFNALHVYGKLINLGLPKHWSRKISKTYEKITHKLLYTSGMTISKKIRRE